MGGGEGMGGEGRERVGGTAGRWTGGRNVALGEGAVDVDGGADLGSRILIKALANGADGAADEAAGPGGALGERGVLGAGDGEGGEWEASDAAADGVYD